MKKRQILSIFVALALCAGSAALMSGCHASIVQYTNGAAPAASEAASEDGGTDESEADTPDESSEAEAESSEAEDESSEAEEESSAAEEESSEAEAESSEVVESKSETSVSISFKKPDDWGNVVYVKPFKKNDYAGAKLPMKNNNDGTYSITIDLSTLSLDPSDAVVTFCDDDPKHTYPKTSAYPLKDGETYGDDDDADL